MSIINTKTVGVTFKNRQETIKNITAHAAENHYKMWCSVEREADNAHDPNAIAVIMHTYRMKGQIGYLDAELAAQLAPIMDANKSEVTVWCDGFAVRSGGPKGTRGVALKLDVRDNTLKLTNK